MVHWIIFSERKMGISKVHYHRYLRDVHAPLVDSNLCPRYVQNHIIEKPEGIPWDSIIDMWWDTVGAAVEFWTSDCGERCHNDEPYFARGWRSQRMIAEDDVLLEGPPMSKNDTLAKAVFAFRRKVDMDVDEFRRYWREVHGPLVLKLPRLRRYVQCKTMAIKHLQDLGRLPEGEPFFDGVEYLWFDNKAALRESLESLVAFADVNPDFQNFIELERLVSLVVEEYRVIWPEG